VRPTGIGEDAAVAEGPRPPLETALRRADDRPLGERVDHPLAEAPFVTDLLGGQAVLGDRRTGVLAAVGLPPVGVLHHEAPRLAEYAMVGPQRGSDRPPAVARGGLDVQLCERGLPGYATVRAAGRGDP